MAWVKRNDSGAIVSVFMHGPNVAEGATEEIANDAQELRDFLASTGSPTAPTAITRRQFYTALALSGGITQEEALAGIAGTALPVSIEAFIDAMPDPIQRFIAKGLLLGSNTFSINHPLTAQMGAANGWSQAQIEEFFAMAATL